MNRLFSSIKRLILTNCLLLLTLVGFAQSPQDSLQVEAIFPEDSIQDSNDATVTENTEKNETNIVRRSTIKKRNRHLVATDQAENKSAEAIKQERFNDQLRQNTENAPWKRIIYREINLDSANNAVLYYPPRPTEANSNLFTMLFRLINKGKIKAYEYTDGIEFFDKAHEIKFDEFLDRFGIYAKKIEEGNQNYYDVADADIPSDLVKAYYIKEEYYFDPITSTTDVRILALCPILYDSMESSELLKFPLFWVCYDDIRYYLNTKTIMLSEQNNVEDYTLDSFFRLGLYKGDIYKTLNLRGLALAQYCSTPDSLHHEQQKIEQELKKIDQSLWSKNAKEISSNEDSIEELEKENNALEGETARARRQQLQEKNNGLFKKTSSKIHNSRRKAKTVKSKSTAKTSNAKRSARSRF